MQAIEALRQVMKNPSLGMRRTKEAKQDPWLYWHMPQGSDRIFCVHMIAGKTTRKEEVTLALSVLVSDEEAWETFRIKTRPLTSESTVLSMEKNPEENTDPEVSRVCTDWRRMYSLLKVYAHKVNIHNSGTDPCWCDICVLGAVELENMGFWERNSDD